MTNDPYRYFRVEARELLEGITQGVLELEKGAGDKRAVASLLRLAHTLKGASRVVRQPEIAELAHGIESILAPYREGEAVVPRDSAVEMLRLADAIGGRVAILDAPRAAGPETAARPVAEEALETVRVEVEDIESVLGGLAEVGFEITGLDTQAGMVRRAKRMARTVLEQFPQAAETGRARPLAEELVHLLQRIERGLAAGIGRAGRELAETHEAAQRLRLMPASVIFAPLARAIRDAAVTLGKDVEFVTRGGDVRLEANLLMVLRDALLHVVRNAVAHGIEPAEARREAGKPPTGHVSLCVERRGSRVVFLCRDDGGGIDLAAVRRAAVKAGIVSPPAAESLDSERAVKLLLQGGLSTTGTLTGISGRGIGMDVVREAGARLKADISIDSSAGGGTEVKFKVPVSALSLRALVVSAGATVLIPLDCARRVVTVAERDIARSGSHESIVFENRSIPFARMGCLLRQETGAPVRDPWPAVVIASGGAMAAVAVDSVAEITTVLLRVLPDDAAAAPLVGGACLDEKGNPRLILDPAAMIAAIEGAPPRPVPAEPQAAPAVLVVDDSLTTRMLEKSILESAGFVVELATSGEEGLAKARSRDYSLFLVDVEMPGMDGFEFLSQTRSDARLRRTPAILVTSRNTPEDRNRGRELGASNYIVKNEFDQDYFLRIIRQLAGAS